MHKKYLIQSIVLLMFGAAGLLSTGCASLSGAENKDSYLASAQKNFDAGVKLLADEHYEEAISYFDHVRSKFPYSQFAALSDLRIADAYFAQQKWTLSADSYDVFIKLHPRHPEAEFATYQLAKSYLAAVPSDFFLFPKSYTRDQKASKDALAAAEVLLERFPGSKYREEIGLIKAGILEKLALHDMKVASFYEARKRWLGACNRFERVVELYPQTSSAAEALYRSATIALTYLQDSEKAKQLFAKLKENYKDSSYAELISAELLKIPN